MEIKFRGKRIDNGEWVYGVPFIVAEEAAFIIDNCSTLRFSNEDSSFNGWRVSDESIGQMWNPSEGLFVYTGDLLMATCSPSGSNIKTRRLCKVDFDNDGMSISVWYKNEWWGYGSMNFSTAELVGNIIDNPELLNK